jgi:hypothetical protein
MMLADCSELGMLTLSVGCLKKGCSRLLVDYSEKAVMTLSVGC